MMTKTVSPAREYGTAGDPLVSGPERGNTGPPAGTAHDERFAVCMLLITKS
jgi:hypothetical protein